MADERPTSRAQPEVREAEDTSLSPTIQLGSSSSDDSPQLAHERTSNTKVPVTPGINLSTYRQSPALNDHALAPSYFTRDPAKQDRRPQQEFSFSTQNILKGAMTSQEVLRRMSLSLQGRRESISEIRNAAPDLGLTGNVISATYVTPYRITHHKNGEWVCVVPARRP